MSLALLTSLSTLHSIHTAMTFLTDRRLMNFGHHALLTPPCIKFRPGLAESFSGALQRAKQCTLICFWLVALHCVALPQAPYRCQDSSIHKQPHGHQLKACSIRARRGEPKPA